MTTGWLVQGRRLVCIPTGSVSWIKDMLYVKAGY